MRCLTSLILTSALCIAGCAADTVKGPVGSTGFAGTGTAFGAAGSRAVGNQVGVGTAGGFAPGAAGRGPTTPVVTPNTGITPPGTGGAAGKPAVVPPPPPAAGSGGPVVPPPPPPPAAGSGAPGGMGLPPTAAGSVEPKVPTAMGDCPEFKTGMATIGGLAGISLQVGAMSAEKKGALLFYWHGTGSTAGEVSMFPGVKDIVAGGGIVVSPGASSGKGGDCSGTGTFSQGDFEIADLIYSCAVKNYNIDPRRVYTTGCSAGGLQAGCMAAMRSSYIAASLPNSGGMVGRIPMQDKHTPALMTMHGGANDMVIVTFSETSKTIDDAFVASGGFVMNCDHGGGHCGAPAALQSSGWTFMKDHPFGVTPEPYAAGIPAGFPDYCKILSK
jgi:hypothetical protein